MVESGLAEYFAGCSPTQVRLVSSDRDCGFRGSSWQHLKWNWLGGAVLRVPEWVSKEARIGDRRKGKRTAAFFPRSLPSAFLLTWVTWGEDRPGVRAGTESGPICHGLEAETGPRSPCSLSERKLRPKRRWRQPRALDTPLP